MTSPSFSLALVAAALLLVFTGCAHKSNLAFSGNDLDSLFKRVDAAEAQAENDQTKKAKASYVIDELEPRAVSVVETPEVVERVPLLTLNGVLMPAFTGTVTGGALTPEIETPVFTENDLLELKTAPESVSLFRPAPGSLKLTGGSGFTYERTLSATSVRPPDPNWMRMMMVIRPFSDHAASSPN